ncbi:diguanylate cyclase (GGDEF)-like protein/PAS domain S-box-containing protein [Actimicrobium sp. GrIS 1.19]|uniref:EAL domain-containing protein n=1 Tax=Actimicrobium sp. GrIS 1.19 TaxID=3071708 RepID=UPI002DFF2675|nr:diguanylate cyclase (GGDEF)-like protein/PAS domain S-box-containing protein [Actimicrobium sp. GrIS 1.19]
MSEILKVLMLEDVATEAELARRELIRGGLNIEVSRVETRNAFIAQMAEFRPDVILSDFSLPGFDGISALKLARDAHPEIPFIFVSGTIGEETAINALKGGAVDYLLKTNLQRLAIAVRRAVDEARGQAARVRAESRFHDLIEYAPHAIVVIDQHGCIDIVNAQAELLFGYARSEMLGASANLLVTTASAQWHVLPPDSAASSGGTVSFELTAQRRDGTRFPAEISLSRLQTADGLWISSVIRDVSERWAQQERLLRMTRIRTILGSINSVILRVRDKQTLLDEACRIAFEQGEFAGAVVGVRDAETQVMRPVAWAGVDEPFLHALELIANEPVRPGQGLIGLALRDMHSVISNDIGSDPRMAPWRSQFLERGYRSAFVVPLMAGEHPFGILALLSEHVDAFNDDEQHLLSELADDISFSHDFIAKEEQINYLAYFDSLTGLPNRALFLERVGQLLNANASGAQDHLAMVLIDVERFRHINETFGRLAGDELLRVVARRLRDSLPDAGYLARINADSFAFIARGNCDAVDVAALIEKDLAGVVGEPMQIRDKSVRLTMRAGIAMYPIDGADSDSLLRNAEAALKDAKIAKVRSLFYTADMNARTAERYSLEGRLRRALEEQQFVLHYQPKVDLQNGRIVGMEALIRWNEPGVGLVPPLQFIPMLEESGLIVEVGSWVIAHAHQQYQAWSAMGLAVPRIAVNVSQLQIRQNDFVPRVLAILAVGESSDLEIEITESLFMDDNDPNVSRGKLAALREAGLTIAIDDFGTGYSSLSYLARLPIDTLKIDRSFITGMTSSAENMAIVSTIISLAESLRLGSVAEGVETIEQREQLRLLGCDQMQGFLFSPGVPADVMAGMLTLQ